MLRLFVVALIAWAACQPDSIDLTQTGNASDNAVPSYLREIMSDSHNTCVYYRSQQIEVVHECPALEKWFKDKSPPATELYLAQSVRPPPEFQALTFIESAKVWHIASQHSYSGALDLNLKNQGNNDLVRFGHVFNPNNRHVYLNYEFRRIVSRDLSSCGEDVLVASRLKYADEYEPIERVLNQLLATLCPGVFEAIGPERNMGCQ